jgi:uncharacterized MAPEG superfamily protein
MEFVTIVAMLSLIEFMAFGGAVGKSRVKTGISAPAVTGDESFERYYRVHQNTLEQLIVFIPALYAFGYYVNDLAAVALGTVFLVGRALYFRAYTADPNSRGLGFMLSFVPNVILTFGGIIGALITAFG